MAVAEVSLSSCWWLAGPEAVASAAGIFCVRTRATQLSPVVGAAAARAVTTSSTSARTLPLGPVRSMRIASGQAQAKQTPTRCCDPMAAQRSHGILVVTSRF